MLIEVFPDIGLSDLIGFKSILKLALNGEDIVLIGGESLQIGKHRNQLFHAVFPVAVVVALFFHPMVDGWRIIPGAVFSGLACGPEFVRVPPTGDLPGVEFTGTYTYSLSSLDLTAPETVITVVDTILVET